MALSALIAPAISAVGSFISGRATAKQAEKDRRLQMEASKDQQEAIETFNRQQMEREDNFIRRRVNDARSAGIHPLAALGVAGTGSFATPQAAYGGAPITGSAVGDALSSFGANMPNSSDELQTELLKAQIANVNASTTQMLADATSRTKIFDGQGRQPGRVHQLGAVGLKSKIRHAAQDAEDDLGDIMQEIVGAFNMNGLSVTDDDLRSMGPLSRNFWSFLRDHGYVGRH